MPDTYDPPLSGFRVLDLSSGPMTATGRLLADLGARVTRVVLPGVTGDHTTGPVVDGVAIGTAIDRHGFAHATAEPGSHGWDRLLADADLLIETTPPGSPAEELLDVPGLRTRHPALVVLSISDFGRATTRRHWQATTPVFHALTGELSRSGIPGRAPLLPPGELPYHVAAAQAAFQAVSLYLDRLRTGRGDRIDFAVLDGAMQALDPAFGMVGSAAAGVPLSDLPRGRTEERHRYPIFPCQDGYIRICLLSRRQWRGMFEWMGSPAEFADPKYDQVRERYASPDLLPAIGRFFADRTRASLECEGQRHGVPAAAVLTLAEALHTDQLAARGFFRDTELSPGLVAPVPAGITEIDGHRAFAVPGTGARVTAAPILAGRPRRGEGRPLEGIRVLDLGVIVVGGDTGRLFGDLGADVVKIENSAFPDGSRAALPGLMSHGFAAGHRNKRAIGVNLRDPEGQALVRRLVAQSDVVLTNFKPGVIASLGLDRAALSEVNPGIVVVDSSAFGPTGPWARRLGYGPLVRAATGLTSEWIYPGEPGTFSDAVTVYPDHVCARIGALAALALLVRRERSGEGGSVSVAQSEVMLSHFADRIAAEDLARRGHCADGPAHDAPWGVFPTAGDDDWLAVTVRNDADWGALCSVLDRPDLAADPGLATRSGRAAARARIDAAVTEWTSRHSPFEAMDLLQAAGIPAGALLRAGDLPEWEQYRERRAFREELHPYASEPYVLENVQIHAAHVADPPVGQAPLLGEQTFEIAAELLGLGVAETAGLVARGVLEAPEEQGGRAARAG
ncbi:MULTISPECIES: CaiB/BaiF CoA-transferase family protein [Amycolatopsis]|uniref:CoA transferase n=1 Tax=Amycolatopsis dendrobii TaxID=2760662 RepID=A0A7W3W106_9PSEU|nr:MULTISPECIES: CoA transferase [Amycolatopsis]MBB1156352.1 CoA transferase [Amycolatopsis dendrobii]UKD58872.1 CoA transferase [Amycolatopsis sp. FU40]